MTYANYHSLLFLTRQQDSVLHSSHIRLNIILWEESPDSLYLLILAISNHNLYSIPQNPSGLMSHQPDMLCIR